MRKFVLIFFVFVVPLLPPYNGIHHFDPDDISELENFTNSIEEVTEKSLQHKNISESEHESDTEKPLDELDTDSNINTVPLNDTTTSPDKNSELEKEDVSENENRKASKLRYHSHIPSHKTKSKKNQLKHKKHKT